MNRQNGFTLVELMTTLAIVVIVMTVGIPSFATLIQNNRMTATINDFVTDLNLARSEAIKRGTRVTVCKSNDGQSCTDDGDWSQGWLIFVDNAAENATVDDGEIILRIHEKLRDTNSSLIGNQRVDDYISYVSTGFSRQTSGGIQNGTLIYCDDRGDTHAKALVLNNTGRININDNIAEGSCT